MKQVLLIFLPALLIVGCAGLQSTYKPHDFSGGYGEEKLKDNLYVVFFDANGFTDKETSKKYFLRRSSQLTLKNGQKCFTILDQKSTLSINYMTNINEAAGSKFYYKNDYELIEGEKNKPDPNSLSGIIQMHSESASPSGCYDAKSTLATASLE